MSDAPQPDSRASSVRWARETLVGALSGAGLKKAQSEPKSGEDFGGVFVTLRNNGILRGCMGTFTPTHSLEETVRNVALSALRDPRFTENPITLAELPNLSVDVSILSRPVHTDDPLALAPGVHGVWIRQRGRSGCFLPEVGAEQRWSAEEMLSQCCAMKAHLPRDAWRHPDCEVFLFTSIKFSDKLE